MELTELSGGKLKGTGPSRPSRWTSCSPPSARRWPQRDAIGSIAVEAGRIQASMMNSGRHTGRSGPVPSSVPPARLVTAEPEMAN